MGKKHDCGEISNCHKTTMIIHTWLGGNMKLHRRNIIIMNIIHYYELYWSHKEDML